jgi:hypothetical protein
VKFELEEEAVKPGLDAGNASNAPMTISPCRRHSLE